MDYQGWKIYTHVGKPTPACMYKLKGWFGQGEWSFEDNQYRILVHNENIDSRIEIIFPEENTEEEKSRGLDKYGVIIQSDFFSFRNTFPHQQLCKEVLQRITWRKQGFYVIDNEWIPIPQRRILRKKK